MIKAPDARASGAFDFFIWWLWFLKGRYFPTRFNECTMTSMGPRLCLVLLRNASRLSAVPLAQVSPHNPFVVAEAHRVLI